MAVLSNRAIIEALDSGRLIIEPRPRPDPGEAETPYDTCSVDLSLSDEILVPKQGLQINFDLKGPGLNETIDSVYERRTIGEDGFCLATNQFVLGKTRETVCLPLVENCLMARIEGRSSFARTGLLVHFTAPTIHPNFDGTITLEMINLGKIPLMLRPGLRVCQLILETVEGNPIPADSQFQHQGSASGKRRSHTARPVASDSAKRSPKKPPKRRQKS